MQALRLQVGTAVILLALFGCADKPTRSQSVRDTFQKQTPCPANGNTRGPCPGYEADHIVALCKGGMDTPENLQWLPVGLHRLKTTDDIRACREQKKQP